MPTWKLRAGFGGEQKTMSEAKVGAVCGKAARPDLCGGREATRVATATHLVNHQHRMLCPDARSLNLSPLVSQMALSFHAR